MLLHPCGLDLIQFAKGQDIVADDVFFAVVLVESAGLSIVDQVVLQNDAGAALIGVESPAAVGISVDVVKDVIADDSPFRWSQRINSAHVTEHRLSDMVHVVEADGVAFSQALGVAPAPADRNSRIEKVADVVMRDGIVAALPDPDAYRLGVNSSAGLDDVVVERNMAGS